MFAQANGGGGGGHSALPTFDFWLVIVAIFALFYWLFIRPQRQESVRREAMIRALKPNDHIVTHGGIYGVVVNVHREANAVTIRVDENTNTKLKVSLAAIAKVISEEAAHETPAKKE